MNNVLILPDCPIGIIPIPGYILLQQRKENILA